MFEGMAGMNGFAMHPQTALLISLEQLVVLAIAIVLVYLEPKIRNLSIPDLATLRMTPIRFGSAFPVASLAVVSVMRIAEQSYSPFLYFQF
jgi:alginate O-acetyltransferase complex protein AlgI